MFDGCVPPQQTCQSDAPALGSRYRSHLLLAGLGKANGCSTCNGQAYGGTSQTAGKSGTSTWVGPTLPLYSAPGWLTAPYTNSLGLDSLGKDSSHWGTRCLSSLNTFSKDSHHITPGTNSTQKCGLSGDSRGLGREKHRSTPIRSQIKPGSIYTISAMYLLVL